jgi:hypothetical protein
MDDKSADETVVSDVKLNKIRNKTTIVNAYFIPTPLILNYLCCIVYG